MTIEALAKEYTQEAFDKLVDLVSSDNPKIALEAAQEVLDRGWGRSVDRIAIAQVGVAQGRIEDADPDVLYQILQSRVTDGVTDGLEAPLDGECRRIGEPLEPDHD